MSLSIWKEERLVRLLIRRGGKFVLYQMTWPGIWGEEKVAMIQVKPLRIRSVDGREPCKLWCLPILAPREEA
jgi:hypothetical protein